MKIENGVLIVDEPILDESVDMFYASINQSDIQKVIVTTADLGASIVQVLLQSSKTKNIEINDIFLKKFFENVAVI